MATPSFKSQFLDKTTTGFILIDVQERLFPLVENTNAVEKRMIKAIKAFKILHLPCIVTEQYPEKMGSTILSLKELIPEEKPLAKTAFSCFKDASFKEVLESYAITTWILLGIEAHVCVFQTAKDLIAHGKHCVVLKDATSSRSMGDYLSAIEEMQGLDMRVTSTETALFELVQNSKALEFKTISQLIK